MRLAPSGSSGFLLQEVQPLAQGREPRLGGIGRPLRRLSAREVALTEESKSRSLSVFSSSSERYASKAGSSRWPRA